MNIFTASKRIVRSGFVNFWRSGFVTLASILVMTVTLFVLGSMIFLDAMLASSLDQIQDKVDVNVYFTAEANEPQILALSDALQEREDVEDVEYVSREEALALFEERHAEDELVLQSLEELGENPLGAHLNVQATSPDQYENIATFIEEYGSTQGIASQIDTVNFFDNQTAIERLSSIISSIDTLSLFIIIVFAIISILIVFNTIRLAIYTSREEISVMKLVGASNTYIRGPFVVSGVLYGVISGLLALILLYPATLWAGPFTRNFFGGTSVFDYYINNFAEIFIILIVTGVVLGAISSFLAVKKYLKV